MTKGYKNHEKIQELCRGLTKFDTQYSIFRTTKDRKDLCQCSAGVSLVHQATGFHKFKGLFSLAEDVENIPTSISRNQPEEVSRELTSSLPWAGSREIHFLVDTAQERNNGGKRNAESAVTLDSGGRIVEIGTLLGASMYQVRKIMSRYVVTSEMGKSRKYTKPSV